jgi:hypothetical protein
MPEHVAGFWTRRADDEEIGSRLASYADMRPRHLYIRWRRLDLVDADGEITDKGLRQLKRDVTQMQRNVVRWLRDTFQRVIDVRLLSDGDILGTFLYEHADVRQNDMVQSIAEGRVVAPYGVQGANEGVSAFGRALLRMEVGTSAPPARPPEPRSWRLLPRRQRGLFA